MRLTSIAAAYREPVYVDRDMWEKIVLNLLSNAFKYTLQGEITVELRPAGRTRGAPSATPGSASPDELPHIFERFHRIESSQARTNEGSGIGLALVQELVKLHGGSIRSRARRAAEARSRCRVPMGTAHLPADRMQACALQVFRRHGRRALHRGSAPMACPTSEPRITAENLPDPEARCFTSRLRAKLALRACREFFWPTTTRICATTSTGCSREDYEVEAVAMAKRHCEAARRQTARSDPRRRDDAPPGRLRLAGALRADRSLERASRSY